MRKILFVVVVLVVCLSGCAGKDIVYHDNTVDAYIPDHKYFSINLPEGFPLVKKGHCERRGKYCWYAIFGNDNEKVFGIICRQLLTNEIFESASIFNKTLKFVDFFKKNYNIDFNFVLRMKNHESIIPFPNDTYYAYSDIYINHKERIITKVVDTLHNDTFTELVYSERAKMDIPHYKGERNKIQIACIDQFESRANSIFSTITFSPDPH